MEFLGPAMDGAWLNHLELRASNASWGLKTWGKKQKSRSMMFDGGLPASLVSRFALLGLAISGASQNCFISLHWG